MAGIRPVSIGWIWLLVLSGSIFVLGYHTSRVDHFALIALLFVGFVANWQLYSSIISLKRLIVAGVLLRLLLLVMMPNLSEDVYRYLWDGQLLVHGIDPFEHIPRWYAETGAWPAGTSPELYAHLNSKDYYTVYPPLAQYLFMGVAYINGESLLQQIVTFRLVILIAEVGTLYLLASLSRQFNPGSRKILLYILNPVVILELVGNLHLEGLMLMFLLVMLYYMHKTVPSAIAHGLAIATKMVPLVFFPLVLFKLPLWRRVIYLLVTLVTVIVLFYPLLSTELWHGMSDSVGLYFKTFEFNASYYFVLRGIGFWRKGYNMIGDIGPALAFVSFLSIVTYSWVVRKDTRWPVHMAMILTIYLILSTTVHPWYVLPVVGLLSLSPYTYAYVWSFAVMLSYLGYSADGYAPPYWAIGLEYVVVICCLIYEIGKYGSIYKKPIAVHRGDLE